MRLSYVLPDPASYRDWDEFDGDLAAMRNAGYDGVELQIADPAQFDQPRVRRSLAAGGYTMCAFQTGSTYYSRGNCLSTVDDAVRRRTDRPAAVVRRSGGRVEVADRLRLAPGAAAATSPTGPPGRRGSARPSRNRALCHRDKASRWPSSR